MMRARSWLGVLVGIVTAGCGPSKNGDRLLDPPAEKQGFQLHIPHFDVPAGQEIQSCYFFAVPGAPGSDVWINRFELATNPGTHHVNIFRVRTKVGLYGNPGDVVTSVNGQGPCFVSANWADWPLVVNTQVGGDRVDWKLPDGVAQKFAGGELLMVQIHFVNATTQKSPEGGQVDANFYTAPGAQYELGTIFASNQNIRVCPGEVDRTFETHCRTPLSGATIVAANGHFHSRGVEFTMNVTDAMGNDMLPTPFYDSLAWDDPPMARDLAVQIPDGGGVSWTCSYSAPTGSCGDPNDSCCFTFGGRVESQEHCNAFIYYYPKVQDYSCF